MSIYRQQSPSEMEPASVSSSQGAWVLVEPAVDQPRDLGAGQLQPGDLVLSTVASGAATLSVPATSQAVSHVAVYLGDGEVIEARAEGVVVLPLDHALADDDFTLAYRVDGLGATQAETLVRWLRTQEGRYYDNSTFLLGRGNPDAWFCPALVIAAYQHAGVPLALSPAGAGAQGEQFLIENAAYAGHLKRPQAPVRMQGYARPSSGGDPDGHFVPDEEQMDAMIPRGQYGQSLHPDALEVGDIILTSAAGVLSGAIRRVTSGPASHAAIYVGDGMVVEAIADGVVHRTLSRTLSETRLAAAYRVPGLTAAQRRSIKAFVLDAAARGVSYDYRAIATLLASQNDEAYFCSELVFAAYAHAGRSLGDPSSAAPNDVITIRDIEYLGHLKTDFAREQSLAHPRSLAQSGAENPMLLEAIRMAMEAGASEAEAREFLGASTLSGAMAYALSGPDHLPKYRALNGWQTVLARGLVQKALGMPQEILIRSASRDRGLSIGVGVGVTAGLGGAAGGGVGLVYLPNGDMAAYGAFSIGGGWNFEITATLDLTVIKGDASVFFGKSLVIGATVSLDAGVSVGGGGRAIMTPDRSRTIGVLVQVGAGFGLPLISTVEASIQETTTESLSTSAPTHVPREAHPASHIGGLPVHGADVRALSAMNVVPFSRRARSLSGDEVDVKLRVFIPSPALDAPWLTGTRYFSGDGRGFAYRGGSSRAEIHAKVSLTSAASGRGSVVSSTETWGETKEYRERDVRHVRGKPDWWFELIDDPSPIDRGRLAASPSNLNFTSREHDFSGGESGASYGRFRFYVDGGIPLMPSITPNINADLYLDLKRGASGQLLVRLEGNHDGFPAYELYVNGQRIHHYDPVAAGKSPMALGGLGDGDRRVNVPWRDVQSSAGTAQALAVGMMAIGERSRLWM